MAEAQERILYYSRRCGSHDIKFLENLFHVSPHVLAVFRESGGSGWDPPAGLHVECLQLAGESLPPSTDSAVNRLRQLINEFKPRLTQAGPLWPCAYEATLARAPRLVAVSWGFDVLIDATRSLEIRDGISLSLQYASAALFDNPWILEKAVELGSVPRAHTVLPWGVDVTRFRPLRTTLRSADVFRVFHNRTMEALYRPDVVLRAFKRLLDRVETAQLILMGSGTLLAELKNLAVDLHIDAHVTWLEPTANELLPKHYQSADVYVSASSSDGTSISLLEAMATGLPVVVSNLPSNAHVLGKLENGQTFHLDDASSLAQQLAGIWRMNPLERMQLGKANRAAVLAFGSLSKFQRKYRRFIRSLLQN